MKKRRNTVVIGKLGQFKEILGVFRRFKSFLIKKNYKGDAFEDFHGLSCGWSCREWPVFTFIDESAIYRGARNF